MRRTQLSRDYMCVLNVKLFEKYTHINLMRMLRFMLQISQPDLGYDREYLTKGLGNEFVQKYYFRNMENIVIFMKYSYNEYFALKLVKILEETLEFEIKLAEVSES